MRRIKKTIAAAACLFAFALMAMGSGTSDDTASKVGEVEKTETAGKENADKETQKEEQKETVNDTVEETKEIKSEYHVGDILEAGSLKIVYVSSGDYQEDNQFSQPKEGMKYVFIKLAVENIGSSDESVSSFSFTCYADGYSVDTHYTDKDLSATLSPGRTTEGYLVYEVPTDANEIEIEYEINLFTSEKIKFIYD